MSNKEKNYLPQLTWLRGIAALLVIVSHCVRTTESPYSSIDTPSDIILFNSLDLGSFAVTLFFCLSGATLYLNHKNDKTLADTASFIVKRIFRIYPAFIFAILAYVLLGNIYVEWYGEPRGIWIDNIALPYSYVDVFKHLFLLYDLIGNPYIINGAFWSLPVEFRYYLLFPVALFLMRKSGPTSVMALALLLACSVYFMPWKPSMPHFFLLSPSFFGGMLAAYLYERNGKPLKYSLLIIILSLVLASLVWMFRDDLPNQYKALRYYNFNILLCIIIVYFSLRTNVINYSMKIRSALGFLGNVSYSLYLLHQLVLTFVFIICMKIGITGDAKILFIFPITVAVSLLFAWASYKFIEKPGVRLGRYIIERYKIIKNGNALKQDF
ncbi:acyltransferase [Escherichia coli]|uniref:acyltransferase family protein n=1 Tax=Escherichia coli TaxID=562 RepID=UPI0019AB891F|nr:acyltransferase [Escherichia coli]MDS1518825.1 acyltransferase [Escherichia coli]HAO0772538.1 acyltransferase [Escherichia coli]